MRPSSPQRVVWKQVQSGGGLGPRPAGTPTIKNLRGNLKWNGAVAGSTTIGVSSARQPKVVIRSAMRQDSRGGPRVNSPESRGNNGDWDGRVLKKVRIRTSVKAEPGVLSLRELKAETTESAEGFTASEAASAIRDSLSKLRWEYKPTGGSGGSQATDNLLKNQLRSGGGGLGTKVLKLSRNDLFKKVLSLQRLKEFKLQRALGAVATPAAPGSSSPSARGTAVGAQEVGPEKRALFGGPLVSKVSKSKGLGSSQRIRTRIAHIESPDKPAPAVNRSVDAQKSKRGDFKGLFLFSAGSAEFRGELIKVEGTGETGSKESQQINCKRTSVNSSTSGPQDPEKSLESKDSRPEQHPRQLDSDGNNLAITNIDEEIAAFKLQAMRAGTRGHFMGGTKAKDSSRTVSGTLTQRKLEIEEELGLSVFEESSRTKHLTRLKFLLDHLASLTKRVFALFEANKHKKMLTVCRELTETLGQMTIPPKLVQTMYDWLLSLLREFHELPWVILCAQEALVFAKLTNNKKLIFRLLLLIGEVYLQLGQPTKGLKYTYRALFTALHLRVASLEISSYANLSRGYFELGDHIQAVYFHNKFQECRTESTISRNRHMYNFVENFIAEVLEPQKKRAILAPTTPNLSFYEGFPLEDRNQLQRLRENKKQGYLKDFDQLRKEAYEEALGSSETWKRRRYAAVSFKGTNSRKEEQPGQLGDVKWALPKEKLDEHMSGQRGDIEMLIKLGKMKFTNNSAVALVNHQSTNRADRGYRHLSSHHLKHIEWAAARPQQERIETGLKDDFAILVLLEHFNYVGLSLEHHMKLVDEFRKHFLPAAHGKARYNPED